MLAANCPFQPILHVLLRVILSRQTSHLPRALSLVELFDPTPNCNAHLERFHRSLKEECLDRMIFFAEHSLRQATREYLEHYHHERNHQGLDNRVLEPDADVGKTEGTVNCRERLGGLLRFYHRAAAA